MSLANLDVLEREFSGEIILPEDSKYEQVQNSFAHKGAPAIVVRPTSAADVAAAIRYARDHSLILSIRSGGHSGVGYSTNTGGLVIDLSGMNKIEVIDATKHIVRIGTGAKWGEVANALQAHNLALSSGDTVTVGVGGLTQGGGIGWMVRKHGLAIDSLVAAEVVIADGSVLHASATENEDLFWAIRGGGGNFGVVLSFDFAAHPVGKVYAGMIQYSLDNLPALVKGWRDYMRVATEDLTTTLLLMPAFGDFPPGAMVLCCYAGDDEAAAKSAIDPLLQLGTVLQQTVKEKNYAEVLEEAHPPQGVRVIVRNGLVSDFSDDLVQAVAANHGQPGTPALQIRSLGGAMKRVGTNETAFAHRDSEIMFVSAMFVPMDANETIISGAMKPWEAISYSVKGAYMGFFDVATEKEVAAIYPEATYQRLAQIKKRYDPQNIFNQNYNIKPAK